MSDPVPVDPSALQKGALVDGLPVFRSVRKVPDVPVDLGRLFDWFACFASKSRFFQLLAAPGWPTLALPDVDMRVGTMTALYRVAPWVPMAR